MPKAVRHTHGAFAVAVRHWRDALGLSSADRMQIVTPPSHILGLLNIAMALDTGAWIRLHRRFDIDQMLHHIEADRITIEMAVAPIALALAAHPKLDSYDLSSLRYVMWCATPVTAERRRGRHRQGRGELGDRLRHQRVAGASRATRSTGRGWTPSGAPVPGVELRIVSLEDGTPVGARRGRRDSGPIGFGDGRLPAR